MSYYLDYSASTPLLSQVKQKLESILSVYGNPSSLHQEGLKAKEEILEAKNIISNKLKVLPDEIYFTSGATFSNNQAIQGFLQYHKLTYPHVVTSSIEHDDIYLILEEYPRDLKHYISCDKYGKLNINELEYILDRLKDEIVLLSIQWANNEMGVIQDMKTIASIVNQYPNAYLHTDATQFMPYFPIDLSSISIDMLSMSAQKIGGLKGTGLLFKKNSIHLTPLIYGDQGLIGGTENVPGIACLGEAFKCLDYSIVDDIKNKRNYFYNIIKDLGILVGSFDNRLPNNINMIFEGVNGEELQALLSGMDIYVSTGSACSSYSDEPSHTLTALGYNKKQSQSSIRFSLGKDITYNDLDYVAERIKFCLDILKNK